MKNSRPLPLALGESGQGIHPRPSLSPRWARPERFRLTSLPLATILRVALGGSHSCSLSCSGTEPWWNCCFSTAPIPTNQRTYARTQTCTMARKRSKRLKMSSCVATSRSRSPHGASIPIVSRRRSQLPSRWVTRHLSRFSRLTGRSSPPAHQRHRGGHAVPALLHGRGASTLRGSLRQLVKLNRQGAIALLRVVADVLRDTHEPCPCGDGEDFVPEQ